MNWLINALDKTITLGINRELGIILHKTIQSLKTCTALSSLIPNNTVLMATEKIHLGESAWKQLKYLQPSGGSAGYKEKPWSLCLWHMKLETVWSILFKSALPFNVGLWIQQLEEKQKRLNNRIHWKRQMPGELVKQEFGFWRRWLLCCLLYNM